MTRTKKRTPEEWGDVANLRLGADCVHGLTDRTGTASKWNCYLCTGEVVAEIVRAALGRKARPLTALAATKEAAKDRKRKATA